MDGFARTNFCDWEKLFFSLGIIFSRFSERRLLFGIITFSFLQHKQSKTGEQHADV